MWLRGQVAMPGASLFRGGDRKEFALALRFDRRRGWAEAEDRMERLGVLRSSWFGQEQRSCGDGRSEHWPEQRRRPSIWHITPLPPAASLPTIVRASPRVASSTRR